MHTIEAVFIPICTSCGKELATHGAESKPTGHPFDRDNPYERSTQRVFVEACADCFTFIEKESKSACEALFYALRERLGINK
jgi:hypothetical protein